MHEILSCFKYLCKLLDLTRLNEISVDRSWKSKELNFHFNTCFIVCHYVIVSMRF